MNIPRYISRDKYSCKKFFSSTCIDIQKSYIYIRIYIELYLQASRKGFPEPGSEALGGGGVCLRP